MTNIPDIDPAALHILLIYDPKTGELTWRTRERRWFASDGDFKKWNTKFAGRPAFATLHSNGYHIGIILKQRIRAHRVAWAMIHFAWPDGDIDHINGVRTDNRIANLRCVSRTENLRNSCISSDNTSGVVGVSWYTPRGKWNAYITINGRRKNLGYFPTIEAATAARKEAEQAHGFHANHGRAAIRTCKPTGKAA